MSTSIRARARAKINWSLAIEGVYPDGYHRLDMVMQPTDLCNAFLFTASDRLSLTVNGLRMEDERYLILRAARALNERAGASNGADISVQTRIPDRAGLGGASADCAATLVALNKLWALDFSDQLILEIGAALGADVPFCLTGAFARVRGKGERIERIGRAPRAHLVVIHPDDGISTVDVYQAYDAIGGDQPVSTDAVVDALCRGDFTALKDCGGNALRRAAQSLSPAIAPAIDALYAQGALYAQMTGSGSAVFGVFADEGACRVAGAALQGRYGKWFVVGTG